MNSGRRLRCRGSDCGSILILVLWTIFFLGLLGVAISAFVETRLELARRVMDRLKGYYVARAGVERVKGVLQLETNDWDSIDERWSNSPRDFRDVPCGDGVYSVYYTFLRADGTIATNYGVCDEQAKLDLNSHRGDAFSALLMTAGGLGSGEATKVTENLIRTIKPKGMDGPGSSTFDASVNSTTLAGPLLCIYELLWIPGMSRIVFDQIRLFVTVQGGDRPNINTVSPAVLLALLQSRRIGDADADRLMRKILSFREKGGIFKDYGHLAQAWSEQSTLAGDEAACLNALGASVVVRSEHFRGFVRGELKGRITSVRTIEFVWNPRQRRIEYWHED